MSRCFQAIVWSFLSLVFVPVATAQTADENDKAATAAAKNKSLPLITTRTLEFTTSEGTWISLDLSPDGRTIVFELLGDLYTLPIAGGEASRITSGQAYDMQPRFSPDGSKLVFVSDRNGSENLWVADADGTKPRALTSSERESYMSPIWTPDGEYVIAAKGSQLWIYHEDGGSGLQMSGNSEGPPAPPSHLGPAFSDDPRFLWVNLRGNLGGGFDTTSREPWEEDFSPDHRARSSARAVGPYQIAQLDRETGRLHVRTHELEGAFRPIASPDGRWLVYATRYDAREVLKLTNLATGEDTWLRMDVQRDDSQGGGSRDRDVYPGSAFTPDSTAIITSYDGKLWRVAVPSGEATEIPFTAKVEQELGPLVKFEYPINDETLTVSQIRGARPSPDGTRIAFAAMDRLWIAGLPPGRGEAKEAKEEAEETEEAEEDEEPAAPTYPTIDNARRLTGSSDVEHAPVWSPDGQFLAYITWNDEEGGNIYRVRSDGTGQPERLTPTSAFFDKVAYSRDGSRLLAVRGSKMHRMRTLEDFGSHSAAAELEYVWLPSDGGEPTRITWVGNGATEQGRNAPHIGPDDDRVYVWAGREGLLSMRYDGTDMKTLVKVTAPSTGGRGDPPTPDEVVLSPDGKRALVRANRNVFMITVPPVGGDAPTVSAAASSSMPTWRLTKVGGDFVGWTTDSTAAFYSIGRSFFLYDLAMADQVAETNKAREEARKEAEEAEAAAAAAAGEAAEEAEEEQDPTEEEDEEESDPEVEYEPHRVDVEIIMTKDKPRGTIALRGARLITMSGDEVIPEGDIVIEDNRIIAIGPSGQVSIPPGAEIRDMAGKTIMPGLVDIHAHTWVAWGVHRSQVSQFLAQPGVRRDHAA